MRPRDLPQQTCPHEAGYEDLNDAERLSQDPTFRLIGSEKIWERGAALPSRLHWFETEVLSQDENLEGLSRINRTARKSQSTENRSRVPTTGILSQPVITRCSCSTGRETVWSEAATRQRT